MPTLTAESLHSFACSLFEAGGVPADEADVVARNLVDANLCGHDSHGVIRVVQYLGAVADGRLKPGAAFEVVRETPAVLVVDGHWGLGQVQAHRLLGRLIGKARQTGLAAGTLRRLIERSALVHRAGQIRRRQRLGGLLNYCERAA